MVRRSSAVALLLLACCSGSSGSGQAPPVPADIDQMQPALATAVDDTGGLWVVAGYTDMSAPPASGMGLSVRSPEGVWSVHAPLEPDGNTFRPDGDAWLAAAQNGKRAYYVSLLEAEEQPATDDDVGDGLALAVVDVASGQPKIEAPKRIDLGDWPGWDEPTVAATRPSGASVDTVLVAGTPIAPDMQDAVAVLVSHDGGTSFHEVPLLRAPGYPGHHSPRDTLVRPVLQQDPRPGQECHAYLAFGVYYPSAFASTAGVQPPACELDAQGCRSIAETQTTDCGETWAAPTFAAIDTGSPQGEDFRGFSYAVAGDGTRLVMFGDEDADDAPILLKRAAAGASFSVVQAGRWDDGPTETLASGPGASGQPVSRWRPTLAAGNRMAAVWVEEATSTHASSLWMRTTATPTSTWAAAQQIDDVGTACDGVTFPSDDYMAAVPEAAFGSPATGFVIAWAPFVPCGSQAPRHVEFQTF